MREIITTQEWTTSTKTVTKTVARPHMRSNQGNTDRLLDWSSVLSIIQILLILIQISLGIWL
ncbi:hypothetical protein FB472_1266 [Rhodoglobus vestalii]|uniref:Uncharacterized protein n=1 Tax=Rhodoglobus vestalii TaxID=193384 RepID=A0A8H2K4L7_9MICO|nr:hypothetical protein FB472_1266 [Rhodoglobus vestalii]